MLNRTIRSSKEEVRGEALRLLTKDVKPGEHYQTKEYSVYTTKYEDNASLLDIATGGKRHDEELYTVIEREETGARAFLFRNPAREEEVYKMAYFAPGEWGKYTIPFKSVKENELFVLIMLNACFVKPVTKLFPDEALTSDFANELNAYFGEEDWTYQSKEEYREKVYSIDTAFRVMDEEIEENPQKWEEDYKENVAFTGFAPVSILSELTGVKIKRTADYIKAVKKYLKTSSLDERQEHAIKSSLEFSLRDLFLKWAIYEFLRTEDYSHLKECLSEYKKFLLPKDWAKEIGRAHV